MVQVDSPPRVLLVDSRSERRDVMRTLIEAGQAGTVVAEASDAPAAVAAVDRHLAEVAVIEIQMPVESGLAAIAGLRAEHPSLVIVVCTFHSDRDVRRRACEAGADAFLSKPVSARDLRAACRPPAARPDPLLH